MFIVAEPVSFYGRYCFITLHSNTISKWQFASVRLEDDEKTARCFGLLIIRKLNTIASIIGNS